MPFSTGEATTLFTIRNPVDSPDARGSTPAKYIDAGAIWGKVVAIGADEAMAGDVLEGRVTHNVWTWYTMRITTRTVLRNSQGRDYEVNGVINESNLNRSLQLRCREIVP